MYDEIIHVDSVSKFFELSGLGKPTHPLIGIIDVANIVILPEQVGLKTSNSLYTIGMKDKSCGTLYGRNTYDFDEGVLFFAAPNQVHSIVRSQQRNEVQGWMLFFHPDLIRNTPLGQKIEQYQFFDYSVHEALHLSETEQKTITDCVSLIKEEITERIDNHSQEVIATSLQLLLNLSKRYYERQFNTRSASHNDVVSQFQSALKEYYHSGKFTEIGSPSVEYFSERVNLSANYLSDLLKKETGFNTKDQINNFIIDKAKTLLLSESDSISGIAYTLGFNYPHYFSRLFKSKTGMTPQEYRQVD